jgi:hypothetical protein
VVVLPVQLPRRAVARSGGVPVVAGVAHRGVHQNLPVAEVLPARQAQHQQVEAAAARVPEAQAHGENAAYGSLSNVWKLSHLTD